MNVGGTMNTAEQIKFFRKKANLTQKELAKKTGLSIATIQGYEQSKYRPKVDAAQKIADILNISIHELLDWEEIPEVANKIYASSLTYVRDDIKEKERYYLSDSQFEKLRNKIDNYISKGTAISNIDERHQYYDRMEEKIGQELIENLLKAHPFKSSFDVAWFLSYYFALTDSMRINIKEILMALYDNKELLNIHFKEYPFDPAAESPAPSDQNE